MHWQIGKGGCFHYALAEQRGEALPATVFLGGPPALILAAISPLPENVPELMLASLLAGERLPQVGAPGGHPHPLIASAEFALMGRSTAASFAGRKAHSAITTATTRCSTTIPSFRSSSSRIAATPSTRQLLWASRDRRTSYRRSAAGVAVAAFSTGDARRGAAVVVWRNGISLARRRRRQAAVQARGHGERVPHSRRGTVVADEVSAGHRPRHRSQAISAQPSSTCSRARTRGPISTCSPTSRWTRLTTPDRS